MLSGALRNSAPAGAFPEDKLDVYLPGDLTRASARFLDDSRVLELEEGTHWVLQEEPDRISDVLIEFFSE